MKLAFRLKGGPGSGNHGHAGRPGKVGGSEPSGTDHSPKNVTSESNSPIFNKLKKLGYQMHSETGAYFGEYNDGTVISVQERVFNGKTQFLVTKDSILRGEHPFVYDNPEDAYKKVVQEHERYANGTVSNEDRFRSLSKAERLRSPKYGGK
jgi:hypothetical protein